MAEEPAEASWRAGCVGYSGYTLGLLAIVIIALAIDQRGFDPSELCDPGESGKCITTGTGVIASNELRFNDVRVAYDDGTRTVAVLLEGQEPAPGTRVVLEWWDGYVVALVEREGGRRYKTSDWPDPWWELLAVWGVMAAMAGVVLAGVFGIAAGVQRVRRRRQAATANGKP